MLIKIKIIKFQVSEEDICNFMWIICSEIERQNLQTAASDEITRVRHSKRQWVVCCICRQNSQRLHESSNRLRLDKKQVVSWINERNETRQRSCVKWIPFIATPKGRKEGRKEEARSDKRNCLPQSSKWVQMCLVCRVLEL